MKVMIETHRIPKIDFGAPNSYSTITRKELEKIRDSAHKNFDFERFGIRVPAERTVKKHKR